jgi:GDSL-like Lipase/Acylhydrolase
MNVLPFFKSFTKSCVFLLLAAAFSDGSALASPLTKVFYLGDSYLDDGNYKALSKAPGPDYFSNAAPWSTVSNTALGLPTNGRWTSAGNQSPLGTNYAVAGCGINISLTPTNTSLHGQIAKLLQDYPHGLPSDSLVVIAIGTNDVRSVMGFGGIWSQGSSEWRVGKTGFSVPAADATVTVSVTSTAGMVAGPTNYITFANAGAPVMMLVTRVDPVGNKVTLTSKFGSPGTSIAANSPFEVCGKWFLDQEFPVLTADLKSILSDHGRIVFVLLQPTDMLPTYNRQPSQTVVHETWRYFYEKTKAIVSNEDQKILVFDLKSVFEDVFSDPQRYGFKLSFPCWMGTGAPDPNDYVFWDSFHPSGSMHRYIAQRFLAFLHSSGLAQ